MKKIFIVTEGQSETNFVNRVMIPYFAGRCILIPNTVTTKVDNRHGKTYKGGVANYNQIRKTLSKTLANAGVAALEKIGIENIAGKCRHFSEWMKRIEERI